MSNEALVAQDIAAMLREWDRGLSEAAVFDHGPQADLVITYKDGEQYVLRITMSRLRNSWRKENAKETR